MNLGLTLVKLHGAWTFCWVSRNHIGKAIILNYLERGRCIFEVALYSVGLFPYHLRNASA